VGANAVADMSPGLGGSPGQGPGRRMAPRGRRAVACLL